MEYETALKAAKFPLIAPWHGRRDGHQPKASFVGAQACELIGAIAVAMAGRVSAWRVGDTQHPYPTLSELVRWTADQVGKTSRSAAEQAPGVFVVALHQQSLGS